MWKSILYTLVINSLFVNVSLASHCTMIPKAEVGDRSYVLDIETDKLRNHADDVTGAFTLYLRKMTHARLLQVNGRMTALIDSGQLSREIQTLRHQHVTAKTMICIYPHEGAVNEEGVAQTLPRLQARGAYCTYAQNFRIQKMEGSYIVTGIAACWTQGVSLNKLVKQNRHVLDNWHTVY